MKPTVSVLLLPGDSEPGALARTVSSLVRQRERAWELILCAPEPEATGAHDAEQGADPRIRVLAPEELKDTYPMQAALAAARGDYIVVLEAGDEVEPGGLDGCLQYLSERPETDVLYTDEQWPGAGAEGIFTKPGFSRHYLEGFPYTGRLCLIRTALAREAGAFRAEMRRAEEWDLALRVTERTSSVAHLPVVAVSRPDPPVRDEHSEAAGMLAVAEHMKRQGVSATLEPAGVPDGLLVWREIQGAPLVSIVIPTAGGRREVRGRQTLLVENCVRSLLERTTYPHWEVVLAVNAHADVADVASAKELLGSRLRTTTVEGPFNFSHSVNEGARVARGELLLLLNDDTEVLEPRWLERMVSVAQDPAVGAVGAKLLFEDGRIQHVGVLPNDSAYPIHALGSEDDHVAPFGQTSVDMEYLAVTGAALMTPRAVFEQLGGFTTELPLNFNDVDYCLKVAAIGRDVVVTPFARLYHFESSTRGHTSEPYELQFLQRHWGLRIAADRHVNYRSTR